MWVRDQRDIQPLVFEYMDLGAGILEIAQLLHEKVHVWGEMSINHIHVGWVGVAWFMDENKMYLLIDLWIQYLAYNHTY